MAQATLTPTPAAKKSSKSPRQGKLIGGLVTAQTTPIYFIIVVTFILLHVLVTFIAIVIFFIVLVFTVFVVIIVFLSSS